MKRLLLAVPTSFALLAACSSDDSTPTPTPVESFAVKLTLDCKDAVQAVTGASPAGADASKGAILACATEAVLTKDELDARLKKDKDYAGKGATTGTRVFRILYRTTRGDAAGTLGTSSANVFIPLVPKGEKLPLVVNSHGSVGQAGPCAPSVSGDYQLQALTLAAAGYAVIAPDLAGYADYGAAANPPSAYASAKDVSHSSYDGARALKRLLGDVSSDKVVLVGLSQGGHSTLATLADPDGYGKDLDVVAAVAYAPLWLSQVSWGALFSLAPAYPIADQAVPNAVSVWYHYTHAELLDGPGKGAELFRPEKREAIKKFIDTVCWKDSYPELEAAGALVTDLFTDSFAKSVAEPSANGTACGDATCTTWLARYKEDRPHLEGKAATTPLLVPYGTEDNTLPKGRAMCAFERLRQDSKNLSICVTDGAGHGGVVGARADYVNDWISHYVYGTAAPAACEKDENVFKDDSGNKLPCTVPPPND